MLYAFCEHTRPPRFFEFLSLILNAELRRDEGALHEYLHRFDHDGSGRISPVEFGRSACAHANDACPPHLSPSIVLYSHAPREHSYVRVWHVRAPVHVRGGVAWCGITWHGVASRGMAY